jgi:putative ABC transport system permease protein
MVPVARRNLFAEKGRFGISVAGVAFALVLILTVLALYRGWSRSGETFNELPGQLWVVQQGTSDPFHSLSLVSSSDLTHVEEIEGVQVVVPVLSRQMASGETGSGDALRLMALDAEGLPSDPELTERFLPARGKIVIEETFSRKSGLGESDTIRFGSEELSIAKVQPRSPEVLSPFAFVNFEDARAIFGVDDLVNYGMVVIDDGVSPATVESEVEARHPEFQVFTSDEFAKLVRKEIDESFIPVIIILLAIGFVVGGAVIGLTIYTATIERTREFGVMKAVGASPTFLYRIVLSQSSILALTGFAAGVLGSLAVARLAEQIVPEFATVFRITDIAAVLAAAFVLALASSYVPIRRLNGIDPAVVFRA